MKLNRRAFVAGLAAAVVAGPSSGRYIIEHVMPTGAQMRAQFDAMVSYCFNDVQMTLDDARLVLPDTNRFRYLSADGD